jgi:hypothetical protein
MLHTKTERGEKLRGHEGVFGQSMNDEQSNNTSGQG